MRRNVRLAGPAVVVTVAAGALLLGACGAEGTRSAGAGAVSVVDCGGAVDTTSEDQGELPDETSEDQGELPDETSDDQGGLPDETSDDQGELPDLTSDDQGDPCPAQGAGPDRWFPMRSEFVAYLTSNTNGDDDAIAPHVTAVRVSKDGGEGEGRSIAEVRVTYGADEAAEARRTAQAFVDWRRSEYDDEGHVRVLGPGRAAVEQDW